jgi:D-tyrosyl-tRNA(Tyr) deacylase
VRAVIQRVKEARVAIGGETAGAIGPGLLVFLAIAADDEERDADWLAKKISELRILDDAAGKMNLSVKELDQEILVVSQFTLYGDCAKGRRPSFSAAAPAPRAESLYRYFVDRLRAAGVKVATGRFQATMEVSLTNVGPVTVIVDSP